MSERNPEKRSVDRERLQQMGENSALQCKALMFPHKLNSEPIALACAQALRCFLKKSTVSPSARSASGLL